MLFRSQDLRDYKESRATLGPPWTPAVESVCISATDYSPDASPAYRWVSVKDRLPSARGFYLVLRAGFKKRPFRDWVYYNLTINTFQDMTHWLDGLPPLPKEG